MAKHKKVGIADFSRAIEEILEQYGEDVYGALGKSVEEVSKEAVNKLQASNHFASGGNPSGAYARDWATDDVRSGRFEKKTVIHNAGHYRLAHLLEKGHVSRNGTGRTYGSVQAYPHIKPVEEWVQTELPLKVEELMNRI